MIRPKAPARTRYTSVRASLSSSIAVSTRPAPSSRDNRSRAVAISAPPPGAAGGRPRTPAAPGREGVLRPGTPRRSGAIGARPPQPRTAAGKRHRVCPRAPDRQLPGRGGTPLLGLVRKHRRGGEKPDDACPRNNADHASGSAGAGVLSGCRWLVAARLVTDDRSSSGRWRAAPAGRGATRRSRRTMPPVRSPLAPGQPSPAPPRASDTSRWRPPIRLPTTALTTDASRPTPAPRRRRRRASCSSRRPL